MASRLLFAAFLLCSLAGCETDELQCDAPLDCYDQDTSGLTRIWECSTEGICEATPCETSPDCPINYACQELPPDPDDEDATPDDNPPRFCAEGCTRDTDCRADEFCGNGTCEERPCRSGNLDCELAEVCDAASGECVDAGHPYCFECDPFLNDLYPPGACVITSASHPTCGSGNFCWGFFNGPSCGTACEGNADCPGGFTCGYALRSMPGCPDGWQLLGPFCGSDLCNANL